MKVIITGASGMIGSALIAALQEQGHEVLQMSSSNQAQPNRIRWNTEEGIRDTFDPHGISAVIHLAGAGIADKAWSQNRKEEILKSRVKASEFLYDYFKKASVFPDVYISASGVGIYPTNTSEILSETSEHGSGFLSHVCIEWERSASLFKAHSSLYIMRLGVVLGEKGFVPAVSAPIKKYAGAVLGSGDQIVPWIHKQDVVNFVIGALQKKWEPGTYNLVAPSVKSLREITVTLAQLLHKPLWLPPVPAFLLKIIIGERAAMVLDSQKVSSQKLLDQGFVFSYPQLKSAIQSVL